MHFLLGVVCRILRQVLQLEQKSWHLALANQLQNSRYLVTGKNVPGEVSDERAHSQGLESAV